MKVSGHFIVMQWPLYTCSKSLSAYCIGGWVAPTLGLNVVLKGKICTLIASH
jgi:hypothetical protein